MEGDMRMMRLTGRLEMGRHADILQRLGLNKTGAAQAYIDSEAIRRCEPYVPKASGSLPMSAEAGQEGGKVLWNTPYARRWYYEPAKFQGAPVRGNFWFERMKAEGGKAEIGRGAARLLGARYEG